MNAPDTTAYPHPSPITPSLWWVGRGDWGGLPPLTDLGDCNIYLVKGDEFDVLIDCGRGPSVRALERSLGRAGSEPARVREIWMTHSHLDHFLRAAPWTARHPQTQVRISQVALEYFARRDYRLVSQAFFSPRSRCRLPEGIEPLEEGSILSCPPFELTVLELPGHTPDQLGFGGRIDGCDVLFSGDAAIGDQNGIEGVIGWLDGYWHSSVAACQKSLARLAADPPELLLPGHGRPHYGDSARRSLENCLTRIERLDALPDLGFMLPIA
jgi:glyoxylase-like metal-dependent hydrolase (beta-lactamase superfamily II)